MAAWAASLGSGLSFGSNARTPPPHMLARGTQEAFSSDRSRAILPGGLHKNRNKAAACQECIRSVSSHRPSSRLHGVTRCSIPWRMMICGNASAWRTDVAQVPGRQPAIRKPRPREGPIFSPCTPLRAAAKQTLSCGAISRSAASRLPRERTGSLQAVPGRSGRKQMKSGRWVWTGTEVLTHGLGF